MARITPRKLEMLTRRAVRLEDQAYRLVFELSALTDCDYKARDEYSVSWLRVAKAHIERSQAAARNARLAIRKAAGE